MRDSRTMYFVIAVYAHYLKVVRVCPPEMVASSSAHLNHRPCMDKIRNAHFCCWPLAQARCKEAHRISTDPAEDAGAWV